MSFLLRLFKQSKEEDYETILSTLSRDIKSRQQKLADIRLRERRSTLWSTLYTAVAYLVYVCLWYLRVLTLPRGVALVPVIAGPLIVLFIRRIVQLWYSRKEAHEEKTLQHLLKQQRTKVEETNYYPTRDLLSKYDESTPMNTPQPPQGFRQRFNPAPAQPPIAPNNGGPRILASGPNGMKSGPPGAPPAMINPASNGLSPSPFIATLSRKQWYDKLADALLGEDDHAPSSSRYALICERCFKHNGLLPEALWEDAQFHCIKCDHLNASVRSKREARRSMSPGAVSINGSPTYHNKKLKMASLNTAIDMAFNNNKEFAKHLVLPSVSTSMNASKAADVLAKNVRLTHRDLLASLRDYYGGVLGKNVLDFVPITPEGTDFQNEAIDLLQRGAGFSFKEKNEASVNKAHTKRIETMLFAVKAILYEVAMMKRNGGGQIDLAAVIQGLNTLEESPKERMEYGPFRVFADENIMYGLVDGEDEVIVPLEDKSSLGLGAGRRIDFDKMLNPSVPLEDNNKSTMYALSQVYTQVALSKGQLGILTGLKNGTWLYGHGDVASTDQFAHRQLFMTKNLTPAGVSDKDRLKVILEAEILCCLHAVHQLDLGAVIFAKPYPRFFATSQKKHPLRWLQKAIWLMWMSLSVICLRIAGPFLLRSSWIKIYLWSSDHSLLRLHAEHQSNSSCQVPLLLKMGEELGQGADGIVKPIHGANLVIKIGPEEVIRHEASFYLRARGLHNLPMVEDFGAFDIAGTNGCALILELGTPVDETSIDEYEMSKALEDIGNRLGIHHHDISYDNMVRGIKDGKLKVIDFARAVNAEDCENYCNGFTT